MSASPPNGKKQVSRSRKWLKETWLGVGLVTNSSFLNGDIEIIGLVIPNFGK
jgi:hypothetical protein